MRLWTTGLLSMVGLCIVVGHAGCTTWNDLLDRADSLATIGYPDSANAVVDRASSLALNQYGESDTTVNVYYYVEGVEQTHYFRDYAEAESFYVRVALLKERILGGDHPEVAACLSNLAGLYAQLKRHSEAVLLYERVLAIREKALGPEHPDVGRSLQGLAYSKFCLDEHEEAEALCKRSLSILEASEGPEHPDVATTLITLGIIYGDESAFDKDEEIIKRALAIREKAFGPNHPAVANAQTNLAAVYLMSSQYDKAEPLMRRALEIRMQTMGFENTTVADALYNLGVILKLQGKYEQAEPLYLRALGIWEKKLGSDSPIVAAGLSNLGVLYTDQGRYAEAEPLQRRALAIREKAYGPEHTIVGASLHNLAWLLEEEGKYAEAEPLMKRSMAIWERRYGSENPDVARSLNNLALLYRNQGRYAEAEPLLERAVGICETALGPEHERTALGLSNLADLRRDQGRYAEAESLYEDALAIREEIFGPLHPEVADVLESYSANCHLTGDMERALDLASGAFKIREQNFRDGLTVLSERDALAYSQLLRSSAANFLSIYLDAVPYLDTASAGGQVDCSPADVILSSKGPVSEASFVRAAEVNQLAQLGGDADSLRDARNLLSDLYVSGPDEDDIEGHRRQLDEVTRAKERYERKLAASSEAYRSLQEVLHVDSIKLAGALKQIPEHATLIEYMRFEYQSGEHGVSIPRYLAVVMDGEGLAEVVDLGEARGIDGLIDSYRAHLSYLASSGEIPTPPDQVEYRGLSQAIYARLWQPLEDLIIPGDLLLIAPDGGLNMVSFSGLTTKDGTYLVESHSVHYLSSGRDLLRPEGAGAVSSGLLALGDPDYDATAFARLGLQPGSQEDVMEIADAGFDATMRNIRSGCGELKNMTVSPLKATREEVELIASAWEASTSEPAVVLLGSEASEERLKAESPGRQVIHLATHGYFLEGACQTETRGTRSFASDEGYVGENPLLLSGLFLAGANLHGEDAAQTGAEDGILTAEEVMAMNLAGTQLVVLSACETGLGRVADGEGVYGLRRAFQAAGARTVISALWPVADESTAEMMSKLHEKRTESLPETLRRIQLGRIEELRRSNKPDHPFTWGAFIATGDWR
jgi:CHAT domain-containing protein/tetratricopeptide (TPR) repeat protein